MRPPRRNQLRRGTRPRTKHPNNFRKCMWRRPMKNMIAKPEIDYADSKKIRWKRPHRRALARQRLSEHLPMSNHQDSCASIPSARAPRWMPRACPLRRIRRWKVSKCSAKWWPRLKLNINGALDWNEHIKWDGKLSFAERGIARKAGVFKATINRALLYVQFGIWLRRPRMCWGDRK